MLGLARFYGTRCFYRTEGEEWNECSDVQKEMKKRCTHAYKCKNYVEISCKNIMIRGHFFKPLQGADKVPFLYPIVGIIHWVALYVCFQELTGCWFWSWLPGLLRNLESSGFWKLPQPAHCVWWTSVQATFVWSNSVETWLLL